MQLEDYFDFQRPDDIRIRGHRIGIETILDAYLYRGMTAEQIQEMYPTLTIEQVYATLLYYHANHQRMTEYMSDWIRYCDEAESEAQREPHLGVQRLLNIKTKLESYPQEEQIIMLKRVVREYDAEHERVISTRQEVA